MEQKYYLVYSDECQAWVGEDTLPENYVGYYEVYSDFGRAELNAGYRNIEE